MLQYNFNQVRFIPNKDKTYYFELVYTIQEASEKQSDRVIGIDLGLNNLLTVVSNFTKPIIYSGKELERVNIKYDEKIDVLKSKAKKSNNKDATQKVNSLYHKKNRITQNYLHNITSQVVNFAERNDVSKVVIGYNQGWKQNSELGWKNRLFNETGFKQLIEMIKYKCKLLGIKVELITEEYTSKCSSFDLDELQHQVKYVGRRVFRGLFRTAKGLLVNADVNGALNILRKFLGDAWFKINFLDKPAVLGFLVNPVKKHLLLCGCGVNKISYRSHKRL